MTTTSNRGTHWRAALAVGAILGASVLLPAHAPAAEPKKEDKKAPQVSDALRKPMAEASKAYQAKDWPTVIAKTNEAAANPKKQPYDQHVIDDWQGHAYWFTSDWLQSAAHLEATISDGFLTPDERKARLTIIMQAYYNAAVQTKDTDQAATNSNFGKSVAAGKQALEAGAGFDVADVAMRAAYFSDDYKTAAQLGQQVVDGKMQKGEKPTADEFDMLRSAYYNGKDDKGVFNAFKSSLTYYPSAKLWDELLGGVLAMNASRSPTTELQLYRLMLEANVMKRSNDFSEFADSAMRSGSPGEAKTILEKGFADNVFTDAVKAENKKLLQSATIKATADQASLATEKPPATGQQAHALGYAYFGYKQYDKAVELLSKALDLGHLKNEADTRLLLGISQLKAGHQDEALKTFQTVKGDESLEQIAQLWPLAVAKTGT
jgi:tetratricopeptide (TPR) repeat protein